MVAKCAPPLRTRAERDALWPLIESGALPMVASDHSPRPPELKAGDDFLSAWGGILGCQSTRGVLLAQKRSSLQAVAAVTATNAARRFHLAGKGRVEVGCDADLAIVDLAREWDLQPAELHHRHRSSPYGGLPHRGRVVRSILRGRTVQVDGESTGPPSGRLVPREP